MGILWHAVFARFKSRLTFVDLQRATEDIFELSLHGDTPDSAMFQALRASEPRIDHASTWREEFQPFLELIASRPSRRSQAAECRKIILDRIERRSVLWVLIGIDDTEVRGALVEALFGNLTPEGLNSVKLLTKQYLYYLLDSVALVVLYTQQFNSSVKIDRFNMAYDAMCKMGAEMMVKKILAHSEMSTPNSSHSGQAYLQEVVEPLASRLESIKQDFKENLCLLSPDNPDNSDFLNFLDTYSRQLEVFRQTSSKSC